MSSSIEYPDTSNTLDTSKISLPIEDELDTGSDTVVFYGLTIFLVGMLLLVGYAVVYPLFGIVVPALAFQITAGIAQGSGMIAFGVLAYTEPSRAAQREANQTAGTQPAVVPSADS